jgi:hypothetical protein
MNELFDKINEVIPREKYLQNIEEILNLSLINIII